jgi:hypothetical protein
VARAIQDEFAFLPSHNARRRSRLQRDGKCECGKQKDEEESRHAFCRDCRVKAAVYQAVKKGYCRRCAETRHTGWLFAKAGELCQLGPAAAQAEAFR